jgi:hypothetical protein
VQSGGIFVLFDSLVHVGLQVRLVYDRDNVSLLLSLIWYLYDADACTFIHTEQ